MSRTPEDAHRNLDHLDTVAGSRLSRRTLTKGTAWSAPLAVVAVAAPAYAASKVCPSGYAVLTNDKKKDKIPTQLTFPSSEVTAVVAYSTTGYGSDSTPGDTGEVESTDYQPSWSFLKLHHPSGMDQGDTITLTLTFSQAVRNLSLTITDIDKVTGSWIDEVFISPSGYTSVKAANVIGSGVAGDPFRSTVEDGIESAAGDVTLTWAGPLSQVQVSYRAADRENDSGQGQHIGVGKIAFGYAC